MSIGATLAKFLRPRSRVDLPPGDELVIGHRTVFDGVLRTAGNLRVAGEATGDLACEGTLAIEEGGRVHARIVAAQITVAGTLSGEITCLGTLHLLATGRVLGRLTSAALAVQEGARYEGELRMMNTDEELEQDGQAAPVDTPSDAASSTIAACAPVVPSHLYHTYRGRADASRA
ncbi:MAG: polymer-forming cytoskeletal protein [Chloroflexota bacterium]|nr:polymer-forming cytoskeletal protein [Chloroflexota bacterium]